jgi:hypothetical protein
LGELTELLGEALRLVDPGAFKFGRAPASLDESDPPEFFRSLNVNMDKRLTVNVSEVLDVLGKPKAVNYDSGGLSLPDLSEDFLFQPTLPAGIPDLSAKPAEHLTRRLFSALGRNAFQHVSKRDLREAAAYQTLRDGGLAAARSAADTYDHRQPLRRSHD